MFTKILQIDITSKLKKTRDYTIMINCNFKNSEGSQLVNALKENILEVF